MHKRFRGQLGSPWLAIFWQLTGGFWVDPETTTKISCTAEVTTFHRTAADHMRQDVSHENGSGPLWLIMGALFHCDIHAWPDDDLHPVEIILPTWSEQQFCEVALDLWAKWNDNANMPVFTMFSTLALCFIVFIWLALYTKLSRRWLKCHYSCRYLFRNQNTFLT